MWTSIFYSFNKYLPHWLSHTEFVESAGYTVVRKLTVSVLTKLTGILEGRACIWA